MIVKIFMAQGQGIQPLAQEAQSVVFNIGAMDHPVHAPQLHSIAEITGKYQRLNEAVALVGDSPVIDADLWRQYFTVVPDFCIQG